MASGEWRVANWKWLPFAISPFAIRHFLASQRRQNPRPAADAFVEAFQVEFLVRRMDPVVVEREADHQRLHAEHGLKIADDGDRAASADGYRFPAPLLGKRGARLAQGRIIERHLERRIAAEIAELHRTVGRHAGADKIAEGVAV